jgi:hypothetical protein
MIEEDQNNPLADELREIFSPLSSLLNQEQMSWFREACSLCTNMSQIYFGEISENLAFWKEFINRLTEALVGRKLSQNTEQQVEAVTGNGAIEDNLNQPQWLSEAWLEHQISSIFSTLTDKYSGLANQQQ